MAADGRIERSISVMLFLLLLLVIENSMRDVIILGVLNIAFHLSIIYQTKRVR